MQHRSVRCPEVLFWHMPLSHHPSPGYAAGESLPRWGSQLHGHSAAASVPSPLTCPDGGHDPRRGDYSLCRGQRPESSRAAQGVTARAIPGALV